MTSVPGWAWAAAAGTIGCLLVIDLLASHRPPGFSRAAALTAAWVAAGTGFGIVIIATLGGDAGQQYFAAPSRPRISSSRSIPSRHRSG